MSDNDTDNEDAVTTAVAAALQPHMDDDTCEYISSLLQDDPTDADAREAVTALIEGALDETGDSDGGVDSVQLCRVFFELLDMSTSDNSQNDKEAASASASASASTSAVTTTTRRLEHAVTLSGLDVQSFASGLQADVDLTADIGTTGENGDEAPPVSKIAAFYATMIDVQHNYIAQSERVRRRLRQKELRERMEQEERQRAIEEAMAMFNVTPGNTNSENGKGEDATLDQTLQSDNAQDVHFRNLDLPNLRGGGENLLQDANITLARGKRYGLMGRNGCGTYCLGVLSVLLSLLCVCYYCCVCVCVCVLPYCMSSRVVYYDISLRRLAWLSHTLHRLDSTDWIVGIVGIVL
jgi:hypothetical protein